MQITWTPEKMLPDDTTKPGLEAKITRPSDGATIGGHLMPPGHEFNDGPGWAYSIAWDTGEDASMSVDAHVMEDEPDEATARKSAEAGMIAALEKGAGEEEIAAAIAAAHGRELPT